MKIAMELTMVNDKNGLLSKQSPVFAIADTVEQLHNGLVSKFGKSTGTIIENGDPAKPVGWVFKKRQGPVDNRFDVEVWAEILGIKD